MEISEENLQTLKKYLLETLDSNNDVRRNAEKFLEGVEVNQNYPVLLLNLIHSSDADLTIRTSGAIAFKNYIKRNWCVEEDQADRIHETDRAAIKNLIVTLMLTSPDVGIQKQLSDAISIIGKTDFPQKWPELITEMVDKFNTEDFVVINGVLRTAHSLFKKYRFEFKSNALWTEIKYVIEKIAKPLTDLCVAIVNLLVSAEKDVKTLVVLYSSLLLIAKIFYSLNYQDLPEFFEDNMETWMNNFHILLVLKQDKLITNSDEEAGPIEQLNSQICENITIYAQKYDEEFKPVLPHFVTAIWQLLVGTTLEPKYDILVSNALQFLTVVAERQHYRHLFEEPGVLQNICGRVIIPNIEFRASDEEIFEDNPEEYIRRDIEGSDIETRRRAACDLLSTISVKFEEKVMEIFGEYLQTMIVKYAENPKENWKNKDSAMYVVIALVSRGATQKHGVTKTSQLVNIEEFCEHQVKLELERPEVNELCVLKADAIKYVMTFRSVLPNTVVISYLPQLIRHLDSESAVVHTYAACAIEKIFAIKNAHNQYIVTPTQVQLLADELIAKLFKVLDHPISEQNEYIMRAIMRTFANLQDLVSPYLASTLPKLTEKLQLVAKNPTKPYFNHWLFETFAICINLVCKSNKDAVKAFEDILFPIFREILHKEIQEFFPYVFQILALLLEYSPPGNISTYYKELLPCLLSPLLWERMGNVGPLVRLLIAYIRQASMQIIAEQKLLAILGVFQKLISWKAYDHEGLNILRALIEFCPREALQPHEKQIFVLLFKRLTSSKTAKFVKSLIIFFSYFMMKYSPNELITIVDDLQTEMFGMVLDKLYISEMQKVSGDIDRKILSCGVIKMISECPLLISGKYKSYWPKLLQMLLTFFENPQAATFFVDDPNDVDDLSMCSQPASVILKFAQNTGIMDPIPNVTDSKEYLVQQLSVLNQTNPQNLSEFISELNQVEQTIIQGYFSTYRAHN